MSWETIALLCALVLSVASPIISSAINSNTQWRIHESDIRLKREIELEAVREAALIDAFNGFAEAVGRLFSEIPITNATYSTFIGYRMKLYVLASPQVQKSLDGITRNDISSYPGPSREVFDNICQSVSIQLTPYNKDTKGARDKQNNIDCV